MSLGRPVSVEFTRISNEFSGFMRDLSVDSTLNLILGTLHWLHRENGRGQSQFFFVFWPYVLLSIYLCRNQYFVGFSCKRPSSSPVQGAHLSTQRIDGL